MSTGERTRTIAFHRDRFEDAARHVLLSSFELVGNIIREFNGDVHGSVILSGSLSYLIELRFPITHEVLSAMRSNYVAGSSAEALPSDARSSLSFQRKLESRGGEVDSGSRPAALPGMTKKKTRSGFRAVST